MEIGQPINSEECSETADGVARERKGVKFCPRAGCGNFFPTASIALRRGDNVSFNANIIRGGINCRFRDRPRRFAKSPRARSLGFLFVQLGAPPIYWTHLGARILARCCG